MATKGALINMDIEAALDRIRAGVLMPTLAAEYGVRKESIRGQLVKHPGYAEAIQAQAESLVELATADIFDPELPADMPIIARARLRLEAAHKWAAARDPARWAPGQKLMGADGGPVQVEIVRYSNPVTIEQPVDK